VAFEHESFWVAVAAASPIIALANQITLTDPFRGLRQLPSPGVMAGRAAVTSYFVGGANLLAQAAALGIALVSLAASEDAFSWAVGLAVTLEIVGLLSIGTTAGLLGLTTSTRRPPD